MLHRGGLRRRPGRCGAVSEDVGQCLPLARALRHHLLQVQGLAQLLHALLLGAGGLLQASCRAQSTAGPAFTRGRPRQRQGLCALTPRAVRAAARTPRAGTPVTRLGRRHRPRALARGQRHGSSKPVLLQEGSRSCHTGSLPHVLGTRCPLPLVTCTPLHLSPPRLPNVPHGHTLPRLRDLKVRAPEACHATARPARPPGHGAPSSRPTETVTLCLSRPGHGQLLGETAGGSRPHYPPPRNVNAPSWRQRPRLWTGSLTSVREPGATTAARARTGRPAPGRHPALHAGKGAPSQSLRIGCSTDSALAAHGHRTLTTRGHGHWPLGGGDAGGSGGDSGPHRSSCAPASCAASCCSSG